MKKNQYSLIGLLAFLTVIVGCEQAKTQSRVIPTAMVQISPSIVSTIAKKNEEKNSEVTFPEGELLVFKGNWFEISFPAKFFARPTTPREEGVIDTDEAYFTSPDGAVEFFVYSPQWGGEPKNYLNVQDFELLVNEKTDDSGGDNVIKWATIKAQDGGYQRSYVSTKSKEGSGTDLHLVFGIKYKDSQTYEKYKNAYLAFKESLQQFAD